jgi:TonB-linked SusC/RagA family outer membrane protein
MRKFILSWVITVFSCIVVNAQHLLTGTVKGQDGIPMPSVSIKIKGSTGGTTTDEAGLFRLSVPPSATLMFSSVGYTEQDVVFNNQTTLNIVLVSNGKGLNEVVVTAFGIVRQEKSLGYSTAQIKSRDLVQARPVNVANGLTGKVAGLNVSTINNGVFAPTRITLRGNRSLTGNNEALIIVDGAIYYNDISNINPDDIESINVLKGSSAAAVYGSDASNGVLVITTKKGSPGKPVINVSSTLQSETISYIPDFQTQFGSNGGEGTVYNLGDLTAYVPYENQQFGPAYNGKMVPLGRPVGDGTILMVPYTGLKKEKRHFFDNALTTQNNISFSAGDATNRFFLSAQDVHTQGVMPGDIGHREAFRVGGAKIYGAFSANYSLTYTYKYTNTTNTGQVYNSVLNTPMHVPLTQLKDWKHNKFADPSGYFNDFGDNPYFDIDEFRNRTTNNNVTGNIQLNLKPLSWLNFSYRVSINHSNSRFDYTAGEYNYNTHSQTSDTVIYSNADGTALDTVHESTKFNAAFPYQPSYQTSTTSNFLLTSDFLATVQKKLGKDISFTGTLGTSYIQNTINYLSVNAGPLFFPVYNVNSLTGIAGLGQTNKDAKKLGYFADAGIGYKNYLFVHGSYRTDIDSRLSTDNRYIPYYAIDASLVLTDLFPSLVSNSWTDFIKIRAAHSLTGNASALAGGSSFIADGAYATVPTLGSASGFPFNGLGGFQLNTIIANPFIKPETVKENEVGVEWGFLHNRVSLVADIYQQNLKDGIVYAQIARSAGFTSALINAASTRTRGFELEVKAIALATPSVTWNVGMNYTRIQSKVLAINGEIQSIQIGGQASNTYAVLNQPYPVLQTSDWLRDNEGHVIVNAISGNPTIDPNVKIQGNANPKDLLGITSSVSWKQFTFSITADYRGGYKIFNSLGQSMDFAGISTTTTSTGRQHFVFPNSVIDQGNGKYVKNTNVTVDDANYNFWGGLYLSVGSNYISSAAAWKLREASFRYDFPGKWYAGAKVFEDISLVLSGRNLLMIRPKTNVWTDPEFSENAGNEVGKNSINQTPPTRIISATLAVRF